MSRFAALAARHRPAGLPPQPEGPAPTIADAKKLSPPAAASAMDHDAAEVEAMRQHYAAPAGTPPPAPDRFAASLLASSRQRPPAWADAAALPSPGCRCSRCGGGRWWREAVAARGWRCWTCHPGNHLAEGARVEVRT